ncbi:unnamed protein product [Ixodes pacificus]
MTSCCGLVLLVVLSVVHAALSNELYLCRNEQRVDKQRLQYGLLLLRQQIAEMLTLEYLAMITSGKGWDYPVSGGQLSVLPGFGAQWTAATPPQYLGGAGFGQAAYGAGIGSAAYDAGISPAAYGAGTGSAAYGAGISPAAYGAGIGPAAYGGGFVPTGLSAGYGPAGNAAGRFVSGGFGSGVYGSGAYGTTGGLGSGGGNARRQKIQTFKKEVPLKNFGA